MCWFVSRAARDAFMKCLVCIFILLGQGMLQHMMCWQVSRGGHVFTCAGAFQGLFMFVHGVCIYERLSVYLHALRAGHVSESVGMYQELGVYLHVSARIKS